MLDFSYCNVCFALKQLIEVLHCGFKVTIHEGLVEVQADIFKAIANFVNNFHIEVTTLSSPQVCALLDHMCARHAGNHSFLAAIQGVQHLPGQSLSCGMVLPSCFNPSLTHFQTIKPTLKGVPPIQHNWRVRSTISAKYFDSAWWI